MKGKKPPTVMGRSKKFTRTGGPQTPEQIADIPLFPRWHKQHPQEATVANISKKHTTPKQLTLAEQVAELGHSLTDSDDRVRRGFGRLLLKCSHAIFQIEQVDENIAIDGADVRAIMDVFRQPAARIQDGVRATDAARDLVSIRQALTRQITTINKILGDITNQQG